MDRKPYPLAGSSRLKINRGAALATPREPNPLTKTYELRIHQTEEHRRIGLRNRDGHRVRSRRGVFIPTVGRGG